MVASAEAFFWFVVRVLALVSVLNSTADDPEKDVASHVSVIERIDVVKLPVFDHSSESEWVRVVAGDETDAINSDEGSENGCALDQDVVIEENCQDSEDKSASNRDAPEHVDAAVDVVDEGVVKNDTDSEASPAGKEESTHLSELGEEVAHNETTEDSHSCSHVELPLFS